jgi:hypothetical protein
MVFRIEESNCQSAQRSIVYTPENFSVWWVALIFLAITFSYDPYRHLVPADQHRQTSNFQVHLVAVAAYNAALVVRRFHRKAVLLEDSFVGIDIQHAHSHCWT